MSIGQIVGTVAGFFLGNPMLGYTIGSMLDPPPVPDTQGPRLSDLTVQSSADGAPLPRLYGTLRLAGNVIWSTGLEEVKHEEDVGGGSGGGSTHTTFTYRTDVAIALCEGPIAGIRRIWADTKLIYDVGDGSDVAKLTASSKRAKAIRIYSGSETQEADPLIQSVEGIDSAPAYRGTAYVVFENLQLADFGNRVPNFSFEVVTATTVDPYYRVTDTASPGYAWTNRERIVSVDGAIRTVVCGSTTAKVYDINTGLLRATKTRNRTEMIAREESTYADAYTIGVFAGERLVRTYDNPQQVFLAAPYDAENPTVYASGDSISDLWPGYQAFAIVPCVDNRHILAILTDGTYYDSAPTHGAYGEGTWLLIDVIEREVLSTGDVAASSSYFNFTFSNYASPENFIAASMESDLKHIWTANGSGRSMRLFGIDGNGDLNLLATSETAEWPDWTVQLFPYPTLWADDGICWVMSGYSYYGAYGGDFGVYSRIAALTSAPVALDEVVADLLDDAGLDAAQYDVTDLAADSVRGYVVSRPMTTRAALDPLALAYHFDAVEVDGKIVAVKRGGSTVASLGADDLGAAEAPDGSLVDVTRNDESELPSEILARYIDAAADYQPAAQPARRLTARHENRKSFDLALVLTSAEAAQIAEIALNSAWWERTPLQFSTTFEHLRLAPADIVNLPVYGQTLPARITEMSFGAPGLMQISAVPDIPSLWTGSAVGADVIDMGQTLGMDGPMLGLLLDSVMLRDADTGPGLYVAACGYVASWPGGAVYKSSDGGATWTVASSVPAAGAATLGNATTVLATADCRVWDKTNTLTLRMMHGTLSSATELAVLNGANAALLGDHGRWELIQFMTVVANVDGTYTLSDFLRGRRGTEWAAGLHTAADAFVMLTATTVQNLSLSSAEIGAEREYRHVTSGRAIEDVEAESLAYTGERLKPLAPVLFNAAVQPTSGDVLLTWTRRDRIPKAWNTVTALPQSETAEAWEIDVIVAGSVVRTLSASSASATYTSSQQVSDALPPGTAASFLCYQISATLGRGHAATATATLAPNSKTLADESAYTMPMVGYGTLWNGSSLISPAPGATGYSSNSTGATWTKNLAPTNISPSQIVYDGSSRYVAVVIPGWQVPYWTDTTTNPAASWSATSLSSLLDGTLNFRFDLLIWDSVAAKFTIIGSLGSPHAKNFTSSDGATWAAVDQTTDRAASAAEPIVGSKAIWTGTNHVVAGRRTMTIVNPLYERHQSRIWRSSDLLSWSQVHAGADYSRLSSVQISGTTLIAVGYKQASATGPWLALILRSTNDGATWTDVSPSILSSASADLASIHRIATDWVAVGRNFTAKSTDDGLTWTVAANPAGTSFTLGGSGDGSTFIVAGGYTSIDGTVAQTQLWRTTDGATWTQLT